MTSATYTTEDFVRRTVAGLLRGRYRSGAICSRCLVALTLECLHAGWRKSEIEHAMEKVFAAPGALGHESGGPCARCKRSEPCIGAFAS